MKNKLNKKIKTISSGLVAMGVGTGAIIGIASCGTSDKVESTIIETKNWDVALPKVPIYKMSDGGYTTNVSKAEGYAAATPATVAVLPAATVDSTITVDGVEITTISKPGDAYDKELPTDKLYVSKEGEIFEYTTNPKQGIGYLPVSPARPGVANGQLLPLDIAGEPFNLSYITVGDPDPGNEYSETGGKYESELLNLRTIVNSTNTVRINYAGVDLDVIVEIDNIQMPTLYKKLAELKNTYRSAPGGAPAWFNSEDWPKRGIYPIFYHGVYIGNYLYPGDKVVAEAAYRTSLEDPKNRNWFYPGIAGRETEFIPVPVLPDPVYIPHILIINGETKTEYNTIINYEWNLSADQKANLFLKAGTAAEAHQYVTDQTLAEGYVAGVTPDPITHEALVTAAKANSNAITIDGKKYTLGTTNQEEKEFIQTLSVIKIYI